MANLIKIILFVIVLIGIGVYFFSQSPQAFRSSPQEKISNLAQQFSSQSQTSYISPYFSPSNPGTSPSYSGYSSYSIPAGFTPSQLSNYFGKINLSAYVSSFGSYPSEIQLYTNLSGGEKIDITGWRIKSNHGEIIIPQAINIYDPSGFAPDQDIVLSTSNHVNIYSNTSPISRNFRLNECTGYLAGIYDFNPPLNQDCPQISQSNYSYLSGACQTYVNSLYGCKLPDPSFYNLLPGTSEGDACRAFLNTITWGSCFQNHRSDSNFLSDEWRVWVNTNILDNQHDRLDLFDKQGLLVSEYTY